MPSSESLPETLTAIRPTRHPFNRGPFLRPHQIAIAASFYAAAELALTLVVGRYFDWGRAEAILFHAFRPWLLLALVLALSRFRWPSRLLVYGSALLLAGLSETIFVTMLGASRPWLELTRGLAAGAVVVAILDVAVQAGRRLLGRRGAYLAAGLVALLFLSPYGLRFYDALLIGEEQQEAAVKPDVMLMTALPLIWGETGPFDPASRPASSYLALKREFKVMPLDFLDKSTLGAGRLLLLAHPRALAPEELVALDDWVRQGGRVLILTDPWLSWPTKLPLGDARRPPPAGLLGPLLDHWGVVVEAPESGRLVRVRHVTEQGVRRLTMAAPGRFRIKAQSCATGPYYMARCRVGEGEAILIADADLMRDDLWRAPGPMGDKRAARSADNPLVVADLLDSLGKMERSRISESVQWAVPGRSRAAALWLAVAPIFAAFGIALILRFKPTR